MPLTATRMDLEVIILDKSDEDKYHTTSLYTGNLEKNDTNELIYKTESQNYGYQRVKVEGRDKLGARD